MCSNWLLMKIEEDEGGRPRRIYSIATVSQEIKPERQMQCRLAQEFDPRFQSRVIGIITSSDKKIKWKMDIRRKSYTSSNDSVNFCLLGDRFILYLLIERYGNRHRDLVSVGKTVTERYRDEGV
ncbi:unnamed protein product [Brassica rapa]|uniref:Uncharacterized protein n=1 Tax=Brassica campestris TaxID=3711 RepID=A0A8D9H1Q1_BRACM|nr:unnamed protein product [Brassica rapa]